MKPRRITSVDRLLAYEDDFKRVMGETKQARRRTVRQFGKLGVIIVEETGEPTKLYLYGTDDDSVIVETTASELERATSGVREVLANPPPIKRTP